MFAMLLVDIIVPPLQFLLIQKEQAASHLPAQIYSNDFHKSDCCWFARSIKDCTAFKNNMNWNYTYMKKNESDMQVRIIWDLSIVTPQLQQMNKIFRNA